VGLSYVRRRPRSVTAVRIIEARPCGFFYAHRPAAHRHRRSSASCWATQPEKFTVSNRDDETVLSMPEEASSATRNAAKVERLAKQATADAIAGKAQAQAEYLGSVPSRARGIIERAFAGTATPRGAIKAKCLDCCGFNRAEVAGCTVVRCPLWSYRPFQNARKGVVEPPGSEF